MLGPMPRVLPRSYGCGALLVALAVLVPGCAGSSACTEIGCVSEAIVTFPPNLVTGAYDLVLEGEGETATARCLDPGAPETADNPEGLTCDAQGFTLVGHPLANQRELVVTVIPEEGEEVSEPVRLDAIEEVTPNGPDCPPLCVIRNGQLRSGTGG
jgi:hypothetical protein